MREGEGYGSFVVTAVRTYDCQGHDVSDDRRFHDIGWGRTLNNVG